eukprot:CAMPEP_0181296626 /NCGR_PEP_ID=MMETSP1101-20121128/4805_1 /TAXON_ID=46948 /ORGANISM="Rhodomonas abbreviata, Strain Caron Lab Isolate" /LENGTH=200 /DNA_ID=CAMNT_0023401505 /DNA_START=90 /DNA_END=689 /DNA_ORIENTATION=+
MASTASPRFSFLVLAGCLMLPFQQTEAVYIKLMQGQTRCFIEMMQPNEVMMVKYKSPDQADLPREPERQLYHVGPRLMVSSKGGQEILSRLTDREGRFAFTTHEHGEHRFCWSIEGHSLGQNFRVHFEIGGGVPEENYNDLAKREHLGTMELQVRKLSDVIRKVQKEQEYFKLREERFKATAESTNFRAQWLSVTQIAVM